MLDPLKMYDYLVIARAKVLGAARTLTPGQYAQAFPIGLGSLARTLTHVMGSEWYYVQRMLDREIPPYDQWEIKDENPPPFAVIDERWIKQADETRAAILAITRANAWDNPQEYTYTNDDRVRMVSTATPAGQFIQLFQHEVHHRAQAINMLKHLGHTLGDVDFNSLMFTRRPVE
jgi:uncharacterized damage-inducible protein DinB